MNSENIIFEKIIFTNGITIGENIQGYLVVTFNRPMLLKSLSLDFCSVIYTGLSPIGMGTSIFLDDEPNEKTWTGIERIVKSTEKYPVEYPHYVSEGRITEMPPGTYRYRFEIKTTKEHHVTSMIGNGVGICYELVPNAEDCEGNVISGNPQLVPLLYNETENAPYPLCQLK